MVSFSVMTTEAVDDIPSASKQENIQFIHSLFNCHVYVSHKYLFLRRNLPCGVKCISNSPGCRIEEVN